MPKTHKDRGVTDKTQTPTEEVPEIAEVVEETESSTEETPETVETVEEKAEVTEEEAKDEVQSYEDMVEKEVNEELDTLYTPPRKSTPRKKR